MLLDIIRSVLNEPDSPLGTDELAERVLTRIPSDRLAEALREAVPLMVMQERSKANRKILQSPRSDGDGDGDGGGDGDRLPARLPSSAPVPAPAPSGMTGGIRYASPRSALLVNAMLRMTITGRRNRAVPLGEAGVADIRYEIDVNARKGMTLLARAAIFDDILHEMAERQVQRVADLPPASIQALGGRLQDLYAPASTAHSTMLQATPL